MQQDASEFFLLLMGVLDNDLAIVSYEIIVRPLIHIMIAFLIMYYLDLKV